MNNFENLRLWLKFTTHLVYHHAAVSIIFFFSLNKIKLWNIISFLSCGVLVYPEELENMHLMQRDFDNQHL